ncbi:MAG: nucleotidyltransferase family protein [Bacteroidetes bacterium]|nr:nucleotidyltransferase family protein [Bacteroidota bacterium]
MPVVIILAGGLGSRLRDVTSCVPKPMAEINGKPFLAYLLKFLSDQGINEIVLSVGYKSEAITEHFHDKYDDILIKYAIEDQPLGTGGAIRNALQFVKNKYVFIMNGDTLFPINLATLFDFHKSKSSCITLALKFMRNLERYGKVTIDAEGKVTGFDEKRDGESGLINGGIYLICRGVFDDISLPDKFSFEVDFLEKYYRQETTYGLPFDDYFIDIGVPQDYERAKTELKRLGY